MRSKSSLVLGCLSFSLVAVGFACSSTSSSDNGDGGDGGSDTTTGGKGGSASGGRGGSASGGKGGTSTGGSQAGSGGSASGGGAGGASTGGSSGAATGGSVGSGGTGAGGTMMQGGGGGTPPAVAGSGVFFSGTEMGLSKLAAADAMPGYFYVSENAPGGVTYESVDDPALPAGTKYAVTATLDPSLPGNFIFGWNWRQDTPDKKWNYLDASAFAGVSFWVKADTTAAALVFTGYFQYDASNFTAVSQYGGTCAADPCPLSAEYMAVVARKTGWMRIVQRFSYQTTGTPVLTALGRIDLLQLRLGAGGPAHKIMLTGLQLLKEADLPPL